LEVAPYFSSIAFSEMADRNFIGCVAKTDEKSHYPDAVPSLDTHTEQLSDDSILRDNVTV
jgi:hypothetical protein